jgi:hypothetical protein
MAIAPHRRGPMNFTILAERISTLIRDNLPFALCPTCIAGKLNVAEGEIRNIEQVLVSRVVPWT